MAIQLECEFICVIAQISQPLRALNDTIEIIAVRYPKLLSIGHRMNRVFRYFNTAKLMPHKSTGKFIMVARDKNHAASFSDTAQ